MYKHYSNKQKKVLELHGLDVEKMTTSEIFKTVLWLGKGEYTQKDIDSLKEKLNER